MSIELEIGKYHENKDLGGFQKMEFSSIDEAIATIEFLKLGYDYFKNGESLVVRSGEGKKPYLLDHDSTIPILELRKELEEKYNTVITQDNEIEFKITTKPEKGSLNSNFSFYEDSETLYAKTTTGENLPFKLFRTDDTGTESNLLRESQDSGDNSDFALIERRFSENKALQFFGSEKIENHNDIAWLFKSLEDEAVEHAFIVYDFEDKGYFIQHISTGSFNAALIDNKQIIGNIIEANPSSITLVHNHPSGNLKASKADAHVLKELKEALKYTDVNVNDGIIINLRSGKYLVFNEKHLKELKQRTDNSRPISEIQAYSFSKQVLVENFQPISVKSPAEVAAYITSQKFGISNKNEMLILNSQLNIIGKFILPSNDQGNFIIEKVSKFGGSSCVLYGNNITPELVDFYSKRLEHSNITITDAILLKSENGQKMWESFMNEGKMAVNYNPSTNTLSEDHNSNYYHLEKNELSWSDRVITPKTKAYNDFITEMENTSPEHFFRDGERVFTEKEKKYMQIYSDKGKDVTVSSNFSLKTIFDNDKSKTTTVDSKFNSLSHLVNFIDKQKMNDKVFIVQNNSDGTEKTLNNEADKQKFISDLWAKELTKQTDLSFGLTKTQIDEKQSNHYRNHEVEANKLGIETTPFIEMGEQRVYIQSKASEFVDLLKEEKNILIFTAYSQFTQVSTEVDKLEDLIKNLEKRNIHEGHSLKIKLFGKREGFTIESQDARNELLSELIRMQKESELRDQNVTVIHQKEYNDSTLDNLIDRYQELGQRNVQSNIDEYGLKPLSAEEKLELQNLHKKINDTEKSEIVGKITFHDTGEVMEYNTSESYLKALDSEIDHNMGGFNYETITKNPEVRKKVDDMLYGAYGDENPNSLESYYTKTEIIGGKIKDIAAEAIRDPESLKQYDINTQNTIQLYINSQKSNIMENQKEFDQVEYLKAQFRYLGFGESEKLHKDLEAGINGPEKSFEIKTTSDRTQPGNTVEFAIKFNKSEKGGVFLNSYDATLNNAKGESLTQNFKVTKDNYFTAKEAVNLLEGRAVKTEFHNPNTDKRESTFVKLDFAQEKNKWNNYNFQSFHQNYGVNTEKIVEKSKLIFDKPEYKDSVIKSLEKGNVVKVKFEMNDQVIEGKAILNPQDRNLKLYDNDMNRLNSNKPLQGLDIEDKHEKANVREQSMSRGI